MDTALPTQQLFEKAKQLAELANELNVGQKDLDLLLRIDRINDGKQRQWPKKFIGAILDLTPRALNLREQEARNAAFRERLEASLQAVAQVHPIILMLSATGAEPRSKAYLLNVLTEHGYRHQVAESWFLRACDADYLVASRTLGQNREPLFRQVTCWQNEDHGLREKCLSVGC